MPKLRAPLIAFTILALAASPLLVPLVGLGPSDGPRAYATTAGAPASDKHDGSNKGADDNDNNGGNGNHNGNGNRNDNDNDNDENDNQDDRMVSAPPRAQPAAPPSPPACSTPGQEMTFTSSDGRISVRVFGSMSQSVRFSMRQPIDPASVPPAPGPVVGGILFQLVAETCDGTPIAVLPAEVNLGVHYADADAAGLNEASFTLARLDTTANQWRPAAKQATDPPNNFTSATITEMGYYVLYQRS
jgi:hypothetical protein